MANVDLRVRWNNYLPHWTKDDATYHIRFRLADSLPQEQLQAWREEKAEIFATAKQEDRPLNDYEKDRLEFLRTKKIEQLLDAGYGECWLSRDEIAKIVRDALHYFDDERYRLSHGASCRITCTLLYNLLVSISYTRLYDHGRHSLPERPTKF